MDNHDKVWMAPAFINMVRQFHDRMMAHVLDNGKISRDFLVNTACMKQGRVAAPALLSMMLSAMLSDAFSQGDAGVEICYRTDGKLYRPGGPKGNNQSQSYSHIRDPLFTDDCALNAVKHRSRLKLIFFASCSNINLAVKERHKGPWLKRNLRTSYVTTM